MAHIPDGVLSLPVIAGGAVLAASGIAMGLRRLDDDAIAETAVLSAFFFVASLVAIPLGPTSIHLLLGGLMGLVLGWRIFPAVFVGLLLQLVTFGVGGLFTLGVGTVAMALPGLLAGAAVRPFLDGAGPTRAAVLGGLAAGLAVLGTSACVILALWLSASDYRPSLGLVAIAALPLAAIEAAITGAVVSVLARVKPEMLGGPIGASS